MIRINEVFYSIQGEGAFFGHPAVFIRTQGCPIGCTFCDTKHTWDALGENQVASSVILNDEPRSPECWASISAEELQAWVDLKAHPDAIVVITGGEPLTQPAGVKELVNLFTRARRVVQIETSGTMPLPSFDGDAYNGQNPWITVSPKWEGRLPVRWDVLRAADEVKVVVSSQKILDALFSVLDSHVIQRTKVRLQPETGPWFKESVELAVATCKAQGFQLSLQAHTFLGVR